MLPDGVTVVREQGMGIWGKDIPGTRISENKCLREENTCGVGSTARRHGWVWSVMGRTLENEIGEVMEDQFMKGH